MKRVGVLLGLGWLLVLTASSGASVSTIPSGNLVQNPGAESVVATGSNGVIPITGWTTDSNFTAAAYGTDVSAAEANGIGGGKYYFAGGPDNALAHASQVIDLSSAGEIASGTVQAKLSAYIGGFSSQADSGTVSASFRAAGGASLGTMTIGPVTPADRGSVSKLLPRSTTASVPAGTRSVEIVLTSTRDSGAYNDGYFDNISLTLTGGGTPSSTTTSSPASPSPVGLWRTGKYLYRWVAIRKGFEERSMTPHKLKHGCLVRSGDAVDRFYPSGNNLYRVAYRYWHAGPGGSGKAGTNCTTRWKTPEATVKLIVTSTRMTLSCDNKPSKVCYAYRRVGS
ncbi:MAG: hypothetical protein ACXVY3_09555 [Gaiellaceae bacterium]